MSSTPPPSPKHGPVSPHLPPADVEGIDPAGGAAESKSPGPVSPLPWLDLSWVGGVTDVGHRPEGLDSPRPVSFVAAAAPREAIPVAPFAVWPCDGLPTVFEEVDETGAEEVLFDLFAEHGFSLASDGHVVTRIATLPVELRRDIEMLLSEGASLEAACSAGIRPVLAAAMAGNGTMVTQLLELGAMPVSRAELLQMAHRAAPSDITDWLEAHEDHSVPWLFTAIDEDRLDVVTWLASHGIQRDQELPSQHDHVLCAVASAIARDADGGHPAMLESLLRYGWNPDVQDGAGSTPLLLCLEAHRIASAKAVMLSGASLVLPDFAGRTPMEVAEASTANLSVHLHNEMRRRRTDVRYTLLMIRLLTYASPPRALPFAPLDVAEAQFLSAVQMTYLIYSRNVFAQIMKFL